MKNDIIDLKLILLLGSTVRNSVRSDGLLFIAAVCFSEIKDRRMP